MNEFHIIELGYNNSNSFYLSVFGIEFNKWNWLRSLFSISFSRHFFYVGLLFIQIKIFDKTDI